MSRLLFLPSTPLNILVSAALACHLRQEQAGDFHAEIWLIDQKNLANNPYLKALENWVESPFQSIKILPGVAKGRAKLAERKQNFQTIEQGLAEFHPNIIATGSDRRIEFQYAMHRMERQGTQAQGWYLDDGLYSYAGRPYHPIKDGINSLIKKLAYGFWWQEPKTIGASNWIQQAWLFQPEQAHPLLANKQLNILPAEWFQTPEIQALSKLVRTDLANQDLQAISLLLLLPHPADQAKMKDYASSIKNYLRHITEQGAKVAVKYHPRQSLDDEFQLAKMSNVTLIPKSLAFEYLLADLAPQTQIVGDISTVLLTAKWLRNDLSVTGVFDPNDAYAQQFRPYFAQFDINIIENLTSLTP